MYMSKYKNIKYHEGKKITATVQFIKYKNIVGQTTQRKLNCQWLQQYTLMKEIKSTIQKRRQF